MSLKKNLSNLLGWQTKRKIIVFESDDWGSIRTSSKNAYDKMVNVGLELYHSNFTKFDALESNADLMELFHVLQSHKDSKGRHPVFTPMCILANPDFEKIKASNFEEYFYEPFFETCRKYPEHDKVYELWRYGIKNRLFVPQLHGREHLNVKRWMHSLKNGNKGLLLAFDNESFGASIFKGQLIPEYLAAFNPQFTSDISALHEIATEAGYLFTQVCGYRPTHFIASNSPEPKILETTLKKIGIKYLTRYKMQKYPLGDGKFEMQFNWLGKRNDLGQIYLTRNSGFEPSDFAQTEPVEKCIKDIEIAFRWNKPAIVSTHRVNYVGFINKDNRERGLSTLNKLLKEIIIKWPDIEFLTSEELGDLIAMEKVIN